MGTANTNCVHPCNPHKSVADGRCTVLDNLPDNLRPLDSRPSARTQDHDNSLLQNCRPQGMERMSTSCTHRDMWHNLLAGGKCALQKNTALGSRPSLDSKPSAQPHHPSSSSHRSYRLQDTVPKSNNCEHPGMSRMLAADSKYIALDNPLGIRRSSSRKCVS
mmetsp:Transcript_74628/g.132008  ORF Transcript_74628/g.132008 Transcript_74628/m.132008 type:complete len:162 (+) Transcript_74628:461-946(+)